MSEVSVRPNFSGRWKFCRSTGMENYLRSSGFSEPAIERAMAAKVEQKIVHEPGKLIVQVGESAVNYAIDEPATSEIENSPESLADFAISDRLTWVDQTLVLSTLLADVQTIRSMEGNLMVVKNQTKEVEATTWFEKIEENLVKN